MKRLSPHMLLPYEKKWVALNSDRSKVITSGLSIKEVTSKLEKRKEKDIILTYVLPFDGSYAPYVIN